MSLVPRLLCAQPERHPKAKVPAGSMPGWYCWRGIPDTQYLGPGLHWGDICPALKDSVSCYSSFDQEEKS